MRRRRIIVVDDNVEALDPLRDLLQDAGHTVEAATDPVAALDLARRFRPEVAIVDIELPIMDGYELGLRLRSLPELEGCVLIALTGYGLSHDRQRSTEAGFKHHLRKPLDAEQLLRIVGDFRRLGAERQDGPRQ